VITEKGTGSGMVVDKAGYVLTNNHVVEDSQTTKVVLTDGREFSASVVGRDEIRDLAVLKISANELSVVTFGKSGELSVGDEVIAVGFPLSLGGSPTASKGIVSAFRMYDGLDYVQIDAAINPGNSGGPLINLEGKVVGINSYKYRGTEGMNLAIAIDSVTPMILTLMAGVSVLRPTHTPKPWVTYTNEAQCYSFEYPGDWTLVKLDSEWRVDIYGPGIEEILVTVRMLVNSIDTRYSLDEFVDSAIELSRSGKDKPLFSQVLSDRHFTWQGTYPAREVITLYQRRESLPVMKWYKLYLKSNGRVYQWFAFSEESEYDVYAPVFYRVIASFDLLNPKPSPTPASTPTPTPIPTPAATPRTSLPVEEALAPMASRVVFVSGQWGTAWEGWQGPGALPLSTLTSGWGYWIYTARAFECVCGDAIYDLGARWNLIGWRGRDTAVSSAFGLHKDEVLFVFGFDPEVGRWRVYQGPAVTPLMTIRRGRYYHTLVYGGGAATLVLDGQEIQLEPPPTESWWGEAYWVMWTWR
jgi:hypothetical protein